VKGGKLLGVACGQKGQEKKKEKKPLLLAQEVQGNFTFPGKKKKKEKRRER